MEINGVMLRTGDCGRGYIGLVSIILETEIFL